MKIGYLYGFKAFPPRGGNHLHALQLCRGFLSAGHSVSTLGDPTVPGVKSFEQDAAGIQEFLDSIDILYVRIDGRYLKDRKAMLRAIKLARVPVVWEINAPANENQAFSWLGGDRPRPESGLGRWADYLRRRLHATQRWPGIKKEELLRKSLAGHGVNAAICVSEALRGYATEHLGIPKVTVLPNGSDPEINHPGREPAVLPDPLRNRFKVLYAGSPVYPWQGFEVFREAVRLAPSRGLDLAFLFLVNQMANKVPHGENVLVLEGVGYEEVAAYVNAADVCVAIHPDYFWSPWGFHGSSMKLFDYMACGKSVVASRVGQLVQVVSEGPCGLLCENDAEDLLAKISYLQDHPEESEQMGRRGRELVLGRYNWTAIADQTLSVFQSLF